MLASSSVTLFITGLLFVLLVKSSISHLLRGANDSYKGKNLNSPKGLGLTVEI